MISAAFGRKIKARRAELGLKQVDLCARAGVSRAVLSKLENGRDSPVTTVVLDKLLSSLGTTARISIGEPSSDDARLVARLRHQLHQADLRDRHRRIALDLCAHPEDAAEKIERALQRVQLWEDRQACSPDYISRWRSALARDGRGVALSITSFGDWENAMFQNSPWAFLWN